MDTRIGDFVSRSAGKFVIHDPGELLKQRQHVVEQTLLVGEHMVPDLVCLWVKVPGRD